MSFVSDKQSNENSGIIAKGGLCAACKQKYAKSHCNKLPDGRFHSLKEASCHVDATSKNEVGTRTQMFLKGRVHEIRSMSDKEFYICCNDFPPPSTFRKTFDAPLETVDNRRRESGTICLETKSPRNF